MTRLIPTTRTCPISGEKYRSFQVASTSRFGMRLDLRAVGPAAGIPWIQCPNGFIVWKDEKEFTENEIAKLKPVVASAEYQRMRAEHVAAYRVVHLRRTLGEDDAALAWVFLKCAWEAEDAEDVEDAEDKDGEKEQLRHAYLKEAHTAMVARATARTSHDSDWWSASIVAAEIERQRGRFTESLAALDALPVRGLTARDARLAHIAQIRELARKADPEPARFEQPR